MKQSKAFFLGIVFSTFFLVGCNSVKNYFFPIADYDQKSSMANLKMIGLSIGVYQSSNDYYLSPGIGAEGLSKIGQPIQTSLTFIAPFDKEAVRGNHRNETLSEINTSYIYLGDFGDKRTTEIERPSLLPIAFERPQLRIDKRLAVLFCDGHVGMIYGTFENCESVVQTIRRNNGVQSDNEYWEKIIANAKILDNFQTTETLPISPTAPESDNNSNSAD